MLAIPAINEVKFSEVEKKIKIAQTFSSWIHFDIVDGKFAPNTTWNNPEELKRLQDSGVKRQVNFEVHLMVENPEAVIKDWVEDGVKRVIVHREAINIWKFNFHREVELPKIEFGLAINPETPVENLIPYLEKFKFILILAVNPGLAGQKFDERVLGKIKFLKKYYPNVIIEVDGGINLETAKLVKNAGADIIASASYIFNSPDPKLAFEELTDI